MTFSGSGNTCQDMEAPVVILGPIQMMEIQPSMIHLHLLSYEYPIPASLESDIAQELSLSLNGALWEKLVQYMFEAPLMLIMHTLWVTLLGLWSRRRQIYRPACRLSAGSTPSKQNPITQASLERLNTCFFFFLPSPYKLILYLPLAYFLSSNAKRMKPGEWEELHYCCIFFPEKRYLLERYHPSF